MLAVNNNVDKGKYSGRWPSMTRSTKESSADAGRRSTRRSMTKVQQMLEVNDEVGNKSPADASCPTSKAAQGCLLYHIFGSGEGSTDYEQANSHFVLYCIVPIWTCKITGVLGYKVLLRKQELRFFGSVPQHFQIYKYGLLCISEACQGDSDAWRNSCIDHGIARKL